MQIIDLNDSDSIAMITAIKYNSQLIINDELQFLFTKEIPNKWLCFWTKLFLGWEWKSLENKEK